MSTTTFADPALGDHVCMPIASSSEKFDFAAAFGRNGLDRGHRVLMLADPGEVAAMTARLGGLLARAQPGQLLVLSCADTMLTDGRLDMEAAVAGFWQAKEQAIADGYDGLRVIGDLSWAGSPELPGVIERLFDFEAASNTLFSDKRLAAVCIYNPDRFAPPVMERLMAAHPIAPEQAELRFGLPAGQRGIELVGAADVTNRTAMFHVVHALLAQDGDVRIDASGLVFADAEALRLLAWAAEAREGRTTVQVPPESAGRLRMFGAGRLERLDLEETPAPAISAAPVESVESRAGSDLPFSTAFTRFRVTGVRRSVGAVAARAGLSGPALADLQFAVNELVTNAVLHGGGGGHLRLWTEDTYLYVEVIDKGQGLDPAWAAEGALPARFADSGRGLWSARRLSESIEIDAAPEGTTVWLAAPLQTDW